MVLATHAIIGTAIATTFTANPVYAFFIAFASHFLLDPIPHWDYKLHSFKKDESGGVNHDMVIDKTFMVDLMRIGTDALLGTIISFIIFFFMLKNSSFLLILASVTGAILPDALQFAYFKTKSRFLLPLQKFHKWIHGRSLKINAIVGVALQITIILIFLSLSLLLK